MKSAKLASAPFLLSFLLVMAGNNTLEEALCAMRSGSSEDITKVYISLRENFMKKKILSNCELADKCLSINYNMETYIPNDVNRKGKFIALRYVILLAN